MSDVKRMLVVDDELSMMIRTLGPKFFAEAKKSGEFNPDFFESVLRQLLGQGLGACWSLGEHGLLVAVLTPDLVTGNTVAMEMFWYVDKPHRGQGLKLFKAFEDWARDVGADRMVTGHPVPNEQDFGQFYARQLYVPLEIHYTKEVVCLKQ